MRRDDNKSTDFITSKEWGDDFSSSGEEGLVVTGSNGERKLHSLSGSERNKLFLNDAGGFSDISLLSGMDSPADGRAFTYWDYDRDGWLDIAVINANNPLLDIYQNQIGRLQDPTQGSGRMLAIQFVGGNRSPSTSTEFSSRDGIGAKVFVDLGDKTLLREYRCGEGFAAQNSKTMFVGIGDREEARKITVQWPSGRSQTVENVSAGTLLVAYEDSTQSSDPSGFEKSEYQKPLTPAALAVNNSPNPESKFPIENSDESAKLRVYTTMATWCPSCLKHLSQVQEIRDRFGKEDLLLYGIPIDEKDTMSKLLTYQSEHEPAYKLLDELTGAERRQIQDLLTANGSSSLPSTIVVGNDGAILSVQDSVPTISEIRKWISRQSDIVQASTSEQVD